ncbi:hypothetical protein ACH5RR_031552 [Cinchona calisaya]|uniref:Uncharacterized protein n=1 Tax=Cinchona calisaya TaxID=153742 RepID=A0ABD2YJV1_9GENT
MLMLKGKRYQVIIQNGNHRRYSGSSSGHGGYSPRKRKAEAAAKTSFPPNHSSERRTTVGWDHPYAGKEHDINSSLVSRVQLSKQISSEGGPKSSNVMPVFPVEVKPVGISQYTPLAQVQAIDSILLTQATRPIRRLYVENIPPSAFKQAVLECIYNFLLSSGVNYIKGTLYCISCMTGVHDKSVDTTNRISYNLEDSSHKIFAGGISKVISAETLTEIAGAFGSVKAFHFEHNVEVDAQCAFLELGGQVLNVVKALLDDPMLLANASVHPLYGIPEHAKPLLKNPAGVLKLKNLLDPEGITSLSDIDLEEILENIRLEFARFTMKYNVCSVKTVNIVEHVDDSTNGEAFAEVDGESSATDYNLEQSSISNKPFSSFGELGVAKKTTISGGNVLEDETSESLPVIGIQLKRVQLARRYLTSVLKNALMSLIPHRISCKSMLTLICTTRDFLNEQAWFLSMGGHIFGMLLSCSSSEMTFLKLESFQYILSASFGGVDSFEIVFTEAGPFFVRSLA